MSNVTFRTAPIPTSTSKRGRYATCDVGTNTALLLIVDVADDGIRIVKERAEITRLGENSKRTGALSKDAMARTLAVLSEFADEVKQHHATWLDAATTAAARDASNGRVFEMMARAVGVPVRIISGEEEADLSTLSVLAEPIPHRPADVPIVVLDIGGGSTELIMCEHQNIVSRVSHPIGSVRLTEQFGTQDKVSASQLAELREEIKKHLNSSPTPREGFSLIGLAGTVTSLGAMHLNLKAYDSNAVHYSSIPVRAISALVEHLASLSLTERQRQTGLEPKRADVIVAGACLVHEVMLALGAQELIVSDRGLRWGLLHVGLASAS